MSQELTLTAHPRENRKKSARDARASGRVPGVLYGHNVAPILLEVDAPDMLKTFRKSGMSTLINLKVDGKGHNVLVHDYQLCPVHDVFTHIDFFQVNLKEKTVVTVPVQFIGESLAVKNLGGTLLKEHSEIEIRCLPTDIPHEITVDIAVLENIGDHITIADLKLDSSKFEVMHLEPEAIICTIAGHSAAEEEDDTAAPESAEVPSEKGGEKKE